MRRECRERFPGHRLKRKPIVRDPGMHDGMCVTHVSGSLTRGDGENVPGIPGTCATRNFTYLARGPLWRLACCSQNTVANAQKPIVTSHCSHVPLRRKRQCSFYRSPLNLIWHYKHVCASAHTWRHKLEATLGWITSTGTTSIKRTMTPTLRTSVAAVWFVRPTNHNGARYFLRTTLTWPRIFRVSADDSNRETCSV